MLHCVFYAVFVYFISRFFFKLCLKCKQEISIESSLELRGNKIKFYVVRHYFRFSTFGLPQQDQKQNKLIKWTSLNTDLLSTYKYINIAISSICINVRNIFHNFTELDSLMFY